MYINDLASLSFKLQSIIFADYTNVCIQGRNETDMANIMNHELNLLSEWLKSNILSLNINKTNFMVFRPRLNRSDPQLCISINGVSITDVQSTKFLGVLLDNRLTWKQHIHYTSQKVAKCIGIIAILLFYDLSMNV